MTAGSPIPLSSIDLAVFAAYMLAAVALGFLVSRRGRASSKAYFLGGKTLPWYVVATSMVAADVSAEHFIANAGVSYKYGIVPATGSWNVWIIYSLFIWIFLPYYVRTGLYTVPQFLERRYNAACRYIFSGSLVVGYVAAIIAGSLFAGGLALQSMLGLRLVYGILFFGVVTGAYTIYGGLKSAAWTDFMQIIVLGAGGILVPILGLYAVGGLGHLVQEHPEKFQVFLPVTHERFPVTGVFTGFLTVGLWYSCTSQHIVQRVLAAKDEYNARMGVVGAGCLHIVTPFFFILPGVIAFSLNPDLPNGDGAYLELVKSLIPTGLRGLILAAMAAALMSNLSSVLNSASTLVTIDFYKTFIRPDASERRQVQFGQLSGTVILLAGIAIALYYSTVKDPLYVQVQRVFFFIAPPFAVIFTLGLLWRRTTAEAAITTIALGFPVSAFLALYAFPNLEFLKPYNTYQHPAFVSWVFCMAVMIVTSLLTKRPPREKTEGIVWSARYAALPPDQQKRYSGWKDWRLWWVLFVGTVLAIYAYFVWFRLQYPVDLLS
ncbi:MAG TPA: sodium/solute symporter [Gemmataceae bacterium]|nr:sodium/solute symporter [Gemmataceae bacterium]